MFSMRKTEKSAQDRHPVLRATVFFSFKNCANRSFGFVAARFCLCKSGKNTRAGRKKMFVDCLSAHFSARFYIGRYI
jgi:hypothetical protein